ncbi:MAG: heme exporter protein CcmD [Rhodovulum sulfidophilum]|uniref:Heme exporter protein D n=1 Tax=Rhodovulum sulfidophilum TaxID=35806 RepID=A0A2W5NA66_RHOSU|nr:MAG: heme exporter protein CcmD [Rhodovulum sulfidophilum]
MPDLGRYAVTVLSAYGVTFALVGALIGLSVWRARRVARTLAAAETRARTRRTPDGV